MKTIPSPIKCHGGKSYLAARLVAMMPPHLHYVEPYARGLSVLLAKDPEGISEVVNDLDGSVTNFWRVLANEQTFQQFRRIVEVMPFSEAEWRSMAAYLALCDRQYLDGGREEAVLVLWAVAFFVTCRQSLAGRMDSFAPLSKARTRRGMNEQVSAWLSSVEGLPVVHKRMIRVAIRNQEATTVIRQEDSEETLHYLDPPYMPETRKAVDVYGCEMTANQHRDLLVTLGGRQAASACTRAGEDVPDWYETAKPIVGKFMLSGYRSALYDAVASVCGWECAEFDLPNNASGKRSKERKTECVWMNFKPSCNGSAAQS